MSFPVLFRSYGGENYKGRPPWFSKTACLLSAVRAAERAGAEVVFVNNGPIPEDRLSVMQAVGGRIFDLPGLGMRQSYLAALRLAVDLGTADGLVWVSEDDYLFHPDSLSAFGAAASAIPEADYFALYVNNPVVPHEHPEPPVHRPRGWVDRGPWSVEGLQWARAYSTTATFGARTSALAEDMSVFRFCTQPHRRMFRDHDTCVVYQGFEPYSWSTLVRSAVGLELGQSGRRLREIAMTPFLTATNLRSHRRPSRRRTLVGVGPDLAAHLEDGYVPPGHDWAMLTGDTLAWGHERGLLGSSGQPRRHSPR